MNQTTVKTAYFLIQANPNCCLARLGSLGSCVSELNHFEVFLFWNTIFEVKEPGLFIFYYELNWTLCNTVYIFFVIGVLKPSMLFWDFAVVDSNDKELTHLQNYEFNFCYQREDLFSRWSVNTQSYEFNSCYQHEDLLSGWSINTTVNAH